MVANMTLTTCTFGLWSASDVNACSKPCGVGTRLAFRAFTGTGMYSARCGPMSRVELCTLGTCKHVSTISRVVAVLSWAAVCVSVLVICCTAYWAARILHQKLHPSTLFMSDRKQAKGMPHHEGQTQKQRDDISYTRSGAGLARFPLGYVEGGTPNGSFIVRAPPPIPKHNTPKRTEQMVASISVSVFEYLWCCVIVRLMLIPGRRYLHVPASISPSRN